MAFHYLRAIRKLRPTSIERYCEPPQGETGSESYSHTGCDGVGKSDQDLALDALDEDEEDEGKEEKDQGEEEEDGPRSVRRRRLYTSIHGDSAPKYPSKRRLRQPRHPPNSSVDDSDWDIAPLGSRCERFSSASSSHMDRAM